MGQRLLRAKQKIANAGIPYRVPPTEALAERLDGVLAVIYLVFTEGYAAPTDDDLADEAIRLGIAGKPARHDFRIERNAAPAVSRHMSVTGG